MRLCRDGLVCVCVSVCVRSNSRIYGQLNLARIEWVGRKGLGIAGISENFIYLFIRKRILACDL